MIIFYSLSENGFYTPDIHPTQFTNGVPQGDIADAVEISATLHHSLIADCSLGKVIIIGGEGVPIAVDPTPTDSEQWVAIRRRRDALLRSSDYTHVEDFSGDKVPWAAYRILLRDIPQTYAADPTTVVWPTPPA